MNFEISNRAKQDLEEIFVFTIEKWSLKQAKLHYSYIFEEINVICNTPKIGMSITEIKEYHRIWKIKSHLIIYKVKNEVIYIDRILHRRMDVIREV